MNAITNLIKEHGSQQKVAELLGVTQATVSKWARGDIVIPVRRARDIERRTQGKVKATELLGLD